jgi:hypothetical protein
MGHVGSEKDGGIETRPDEKGGDWEKDKKE